MVAGRLRDLALATTVGVVLADSSIVTLALPEVLERFDTTVFDVSWVLTAFNLVLAAAVLPASRLARKRPRRLWLAGLGLFATASLACALAPSAGVLIGGRCLQALGGAAVIAGAIELLAAALGSHRRAASLWGTAGMLGLALGPAAGGLLTELASWESIFVLQVPVFVLAPAAFPRPGRVSEGGGLAPLSRYRREKRQTPLADRRPLPRKGGPAARLDLRPEVALGLLSAALTGALFLLVIMLTEGWLYSPLEAGVVVSAMPAATIAGAGLGRRVMGAEAAGPEGDGTPGALAAGAVLIGGGLIALGLLPGAGFGWTLVPQIVIGAGIGIVLPGLTAQALAGHDPGGRRAAGTIAARHVGVVAGIVLLTPLFSSQLRAQHEAVRESGTALVLDAALSPATKIQLGLAIRDRIEAAGGRLPELEPAFAEVTPPVESEGEYATLERDLDAEVEKAATHAFSLAFLAAGALALAAVAPILRRPR